MKIDRARYTVAEALQLVADAKAPMPKDSTRHTAIRPRNDWFGRGQYDGAAFSPAWFGDYDHRFRRDCPVGGAFVPLDRECRAELPGERVGVFPATLEEMRQKRMRDISFVKLCDMARAGLIRLLSPGAAEHDDVYVPWSDAWTVGNVERLRLTGDGFRKLCAEIPVEVEEPRANRGDLIKRKALIERHLRDWPDADRDLRDSATNGLGAAKAGHHGMWNEGAALEWARERGKLKDAEGPTFGHVARMVRLPGSR